MTSESLPIVDHEQHLLDGVYADGCSQCEEDLAEDEPELSDEATDALVPEAKDVDVHIETTVRESRWPKGSSAADAALATRAVMRSFSIREATNGATISAIVEVDAYLSRDLVEFIGKNYLFRYADTDFGICRVTNIATSSDTENNPHTKVKFQWSADQRVQGCRAVAIVGESGGILELHAVQLDLDLAAKA